MAAKSALLLSLLAVSLYMVCPRAAGQSAPEMTENEAWPEADLHLQLGSQWRVLSFVGLEQGAGYPYQQWYVAAAVGYQFKPILREHLLNIDPDKEHYLVMGGGYEFLRTTQSGIVKHENRITLDATPGFRLPADFLVRDRNWLEFRWIDGTYSTTYRNMLTVERDFLVNGFRFSPYGSTEFFYNGAQHSWDTQWYTAAVEWPYKRLLMIDTYYRREHCSTCNPTNWNVGGVTLNFYFANSR